MLGMHGTVYANYAVDKSDLMLAFGVRFDDRVTGKLEAFASRAKIVHIDIDPTEIGKNKQPHVSICADVRLALVGLNSILEQRAGKLKSQVAGHSTTLLLKGMEELSTVVQLSKVKRVGCVSFFQHSGFLSCSRVQRVLYFVLRVISCFINYTLSTACV
ncbi:ligase [Lithospermum erythrorhizon]|uniref:Ligase n=1 Tax=Lithospermum erythrorhizon TaxID=34254 RepID=A0AAV3PJP1_LITER